MLAAIVATAHHNVIGKQNELPWYLPADLKRFKELTTGRTVIMGRNTADSILARNGKPLPNRNNIVISRDRSYHPDGFTVVHSLSEALGYVDEKCAYIIGGAQIYQSAMSLLDRIYVTEVDVEIDGDAFFPDIEPDKWRESRRESHQKDDKNQFDYDYVTYDRI